MVKDEITQVAAGVGVGKGLQVLIRKYLDIEVSKMWLYPPVQYVKDLITAGYLRKNTADTDDTIATAILTDTGYDFGGYKTANTGGNLLGTNKLTANKFTYQAAAGQKVAPYMFPSTWLSAVVGGLAAAEGAFNVLGLDFTRKNDVGVAAAGFTMLGDSVTRALGVDGNTAAPSGFDISPTQPPMQYLDRGAVENLQRLTAENARLNQEVMQLRALTGKTAANVYVQEIIPGKGAEAVKARTGLMGVQRATGESVRNNTGLITLTGGK